MRISNNLFLLCALIFTLPNSIESRLTRRMVEPEDVSLNGTETVSINETDDRFGNDPDEYDATSSPTREPCSTSGSGSFGSTTTTTITIIYNYQMEMTESVNSTEVTPDLEIAISDALLADFFQDCSDGRRTQESAQDVEIVGMSASPRDLEQETCNDISTPSGTKCVSIEGRLTIYINDGNRRLMAFSDVLSSGENTIKSGMNGGSLASSHPDIVSLTYMNDGRSDPTGDDEVVEEDDTITKTQQNPAFPAYGFVILAVAGVTGGGYLGRVIYARGSRNKKAPAESDSESDSGFEEVIVA